MCVLYCVGGRFCVVCAVVFGVLWCVQGMGVSGVFVRLLLSAPHVSCDLQKTVSCLMSCAISNKSLFFVLLSP